MTQRIRIWFGELVSMDGAPDAPSIEAGEMIVEDGRVVEIRSRRTPEFDGRTVDLSDHLILPGFVNAHCHLTLSGLAGIIERGLPFTDWVRRVIEENEALFWGPRLEAARQAADTLSRSGVTYLVDYRGHPEGLDDLADLPFRQTVLLEIIGFAKDRVKALAAAAETWLKRQPESRERLSLGLAAHAPYSVSPELFQKLKSLSDQYECLLSAHVAEVDEELQLLKECSGPLKQLLMDRKAMDADWQPPGTGPVPYLNQLKVLEDLQAVHLNRLEEGDVEILAEQIQGAVFCPGSTRWLGRAQWIPVRRLLDAGIPVGFGTDSLASNEQLDFLREIRLAAAMLPDVSRPEILWMATRGGALASGADAGSLEPEQWADFTTFKIKGKPSPWWQRVLDQEGAGPDEVWCQGNKVNSESQ